MQIPNVTKNSMVCVLSDTFASPFAFVKAIVISCAIIFCNWIICVIMCHTLSNLWSRLEDTHADCWHSTPLLTKHQLSLIISAKTFCLSNSKSLHREHWKTTQYTFTGKLGYLWFKIVLVTLYRFNSLTLINTLGIMN